MSEKGADVAWLRGLGGHIEGHRGSLRTALGPGDLFTCRALCRFTMSCGEAIPEGLSVVDGDAYPRIF